MKLFVFICVAFVINEAHSQGLGSLVKAAGNVAAKILNYQNENYGADGYKFSYESDDGSKREEKGEFVNGIWTVTGLYAWTDPNGQKHQTMYKADDKGYVAMEEERGGLSAGALASLAG